MGRGKKQEQLKRKRASERASSMLLYTTGYTMNILSNEKNGNDSRKNALLIRVKTKLPSAIKAKLKRLGTVWLDAYQGYAVP